jgi:hypothetical protein
MTTALLVPTETESPIVDSRPFDDWKQEGQDLFLRFQATEEAHEMSQWEIGDWLVKGVKNKDKAQIKQAYDAAEQITRWSRGQLYNIVMVVNRFPTASLRSENNLKWSHFKELARIPADKVRGEVLEEFCDGFEHSVEAIRTRVDTAVRKLKNEEEHDEDNRSDNGSSKGRETVVHLRVSLKRKYWDSVRYLADADHKAPDEYLEKIVKKHLREKDIAAKVQELRSQAKRTAAK